MRMSLFAPTTINQHINVSRYVRAVAWLTPEVLNDELLYVAMGPVQLPQGSQGGQALKTALTDTNQNAWRARFGAQGAGFGAQGAGCGAQGAECGA